MDAFELRVLARPAPTMDVTTLQDAVECLRADLDTIIEAWVPESEAPSVEPAKDMMMAALFATTDVPVHPPRERSKRHRTRDEDDSRSQKELHELKAARRDSFL